MENKVTAKTVVNIGRNYMLENMNNVEYARFMESKGYTRERLHIDEASEIVTVRDLGKDCVGKVIDIRCLSRYKIFILGRNQLQKDASPDIAALHTLTLKLANSDGNEISPDSRIKIIKEKPSLEMMMCATMLYKDVTRTEYLKISPNRTKPDSKLYRFDNSIQMNGQDRLSIEVILPNLDINHLSTRLYLDMDLWEEM